MKQTLHLLLVVAMLATTSPVSFADEPAAAAPPPAPPTLTLDQLFEQLMKIKPEDLKAKFDAVKAEAGKMTEEAKALRAKADALDAQAAEMNKRIAALEQIVANLPALAAAVASPGAPAPAPAEAPKEMAAAPAPAPAPPAEMAKMEEGPKVTFVDNILPALNSKCASCHNQDKAKGGFVMDNYDKMMAGGGSGAAIVPGDGAGSRLYKLINHEEEPKMPMGGAKLDDATLALVKQWIDGGALKDKNSKAKVAAAKPSVAMEVAAAPAVVIEGEIPMPTKQEGVQLAKLEGPLAIHSVAASPVAPLVAIAGYRQVLLYHSESLELLRALDFPEGIAECLKFSRNGSVLVAAGGEGGKVGLAAVYDVVTGDRLGAYGQTFDTVLAADISLDQTQIAVGGTNKKVRVYSTETGEQMYEITKHTDWIGAVAFSPDGWYLATGDRAGGIYIWLAPNGRDVHNLRGHNGAIFSLDFRPDSNVLASASGDGKVFLWEMENGGAVKNWAAHAAGVMSVRFAADGRLVTAGVDKTTKLWNPDGGAIATLPAFDDRAYTACFAGQDSRVVAGSHLGVVKVFEVASAKEVGAIKLAP